VIDPLLQCILSGDDAEAESVWRAWRSRTDIDLIEWRHVLMMPMIREDLLQMLVSSDDAAPRFAGMIRRAWTQGTMRAAMARELAQALAAGGIGPVIIGGSVAAFIHRGGTRPFRPVTDIVLLVPRTAIDAAISVLRDLKWECTNPVPGPKARDWTAFMSMHRGKEFLRIGWRHVGTPPWRSRAAERALFAEPREALPLEPLLLSRLSTGGAWPDTMPLEADVALMASQAIDWDALLRLSELYAPDALTRLRAMCGTVRGVPLRIPRPRASWAIERALWRSARAAILGAHRLACRR
jgi:hypothetical protein